MTPDRAPDQPPCDSLAEGLVLNGLLLCPETIGAYNLDGLLLMPEHRLIWRAMVRVHERSPELTFGGFFIALQEELEAASPGRGWALIDLLSDVQEHEAKRRWQWYDADHERRPGRAIAASDYSHDFRWWLAKLRRIRDSRAALDRLQVAYSRAWDEDLDGARAAAADVLSIGAESIRIEV